MPLRHGFEDHEDQVRCQRCGDVIPTVEILFCEECHKVLGYLEITLGMTEDQICSMGECNNKIDPENPSATKVCDLMSHVPLSLIKRKEQEELIDAEIE